MTDNGEPTEIRPLTGPELFRNGLYWANQAEMSAGCLIDEEGAGKPKDVQRVALATQAYSAVAQVFFVGAQTAALAHMHSAGERMDVAFDPAAFESMNRQWLDIAGVTNRSGV